MFLKKEKKKFMMNIKNILILFFAVFFFNILMISENTTLILDFINLSILIFILFFLFINSNLNYMFTDVTYNYNSIRMLWTVTLISRIIDDRIL